MGAGNGRAPGDERLDAERGQPKAQGGWLAAGCGFGQLLLLGVSPPCQLLWHGPFPLHQLRGCIAENADTNPRETGERRRPPHPRQPGSRQRQRVPRISVVRWGGADSQRAEGSRERGPRPCRHTHLNHHPCHTHHTITESERRVAVNRGAPSGHLGSAARQPSHSNPQPPPGEPSSSRRCRPARTTGCGCTWRPADA